MNNTRGYLAEFLVANAVGAFGPRIEWDAYDIITPEGIRIEVKSSAYLQAWKQAGPSKIVFSGLSGKTWDPVDWLLGRSRLQRSGLRLRCMPRNRPRWLQPTGCESVGILVLGRQTLTDLGVKSMSLAAVQKYAGEPVARGKFLRDSREGRVIRRGCAEGPAARPHARSAGPAAARRSRALDS